MISADITLCDRDTFLVILSGSIFSACLSLYPFPVRPWRPQIKVFVVISRWNFLWYKIPLNETWRKQTCISNICSILTSKTHEDGNQKENLTTPNLLRNRRSRSAAAVFLFVLLKLESRMLVQNANISGRDTRKHVTSPVLPHPPLMTSSDSFLPLLLFLAPESWHWGHITIYMSNMAW